MPSRAEQYRVAFEAARSAARQAEQCANEFNAEGAMSWSNVSLAWSAISAQLADRSGVQRVQVVP